jgi:hypothetical protein
VGDRWHKLAAAKIEQRESSVTKVRSMEQMLRSIMKCRCTTVEQCARGLAGCMPTHPDRRAKRRGS